MYNNLIHIAIYITTRSVLCAKKAEPTNAIHFPFRTSIARAD